MIACSERLSIFFLIYLGIWVAFPPTTLIFNKNHDSFHSQLLQRNASLCEALFGQCLAKGQVLELNIFYSGKEIQTYIESRFTCK